MQNLCLESNTQNGHSYDRSNPFFFSLNYSGNIGDESKRETDYFFAVNFNLVKKHLRHTTSIKVAIQKQKLLLKITSF